MNIAIGMTSGCLTYLVIIFLDKNINKKENLSTIIGSSVFGLIGIILFAITII